VRGPDRHHEDTGVGVLGADTEFTQPLPQYADQPRVLAEGVGLQHVGLPAAGRLRDDRRDVDPGVEGAGQQQRCHHGRAA